MMKLSTEQFERAENFILQYARPLEQHLFNFHFESGSASDVLNALVEFQNEDGGFGHALEPDFRLRDSSPMATTVGLQILREVGCSDEEPMVKRAVDYLIKNYREDLQRWVSVPEAVNEVPHAPWWHFMGEGDIGFSTNPSVEIVAHLWHFKALSDEDFRNSALDLALNLLEKIPDQLEFHDMLCWLWLIKSDHVPDEAVQKVRDKMLAATPLVITTDPNQWSGYSAKPLWFAPSPDAPLAEALAKDVQTNLDYEIEHQDEGGTWTPIWNWSDNDSAAWAIAKREWQGVLTLNLLKSLKAYDRLS